MPAPSHIKIINKAARQVFKEYGIVQKGQSRIWLDDQYWFTTLIEFQPSNGQQGTYLNVGVNFHWYEKDYFSFDLGNRESKFIEYKNDVQFETEMGSLMDLAIKRVITLRKKLNVLKVARNTIINHKFASDNLWGNYHRAVIYGLENNPKKANKYLDLILKSKMEFEWQMELQQKAEELKIHLPNISDFKENIDSIIVRTRKEKKLDNTEIKNVW